MEEIKTEENQEEMACCKKSFCKLNKKTRVIIGVAVLVVIALGTYFAQYEQKKRANANLQEVRSKMESLVADSGGAATVGNVALDGDLYKVTINAGGRDQEVYVTKDRKRLVQGVVTFEEIEKQKESANKSKAETKEVPKTEKPTVELFVMSYCPYGTQMEKGILPVIAALGGKIDYKLRFVDYVMHGEKEIAENLRQYCIQKNQPAKLSSYLNCFLKKGEGTADTCLASSGIANATIKSCVAQTDDKFSITKNAADKNTWSNGQFPKFDVEKELNAKYQVQGSPTLVINGVVSDVENRDPASILKKVCEAFSSAPKECAVELSSDSPAPGFGEGTAPSGGSASCGN